MRVLDCLSVVVLVAAVPGCAARSSMAAPAATPSGVRFTLARPQARSVSLAGSFNGWSADAHPLTREKPSGVWMTVVPLDPGQHLFMYVIDGTEWVSPPLADHYVDDGFGAMNGVVFVRPKE